MPKLRQKTTGEIFPFMPGLASRPDMEVIHDEVSEEVVEVKKRAPRTKPAEVVEPTEDKVTDEAE